MAGFNPTASQPTGDETDPFAASGSTVTGAFNITMALTQALTGRIVKSGAVAIPLTTTQSFTGKRIASGVLAVPLTLTQSFAGKRTVKGSLAIPITTALSLTAAVKRVASVNISIGLSMIALAGTGARVVAGSTAITFGCSMLAIGKLQWEQADQIAETWVEELQSAEDWADSPASSEVWNQSADTDETWTPEPAASGGWT